MEEVLNENDYRALLLAGNVDEARAFFGNRKGQTEEALKQWNVATHVIQNRPEKHQADGTLINQWKLPLSFQKKIVGSSVAFLFGKPLKLVQLSSGTDEAFNVLKELWEEMRMASADRENARALFSQTASAKLFVGYQDADKDGTTQFNSAKCILLSKKNGDDLYTRKDVYGVIECIGRGYQATVNNVVVEHFDAYFKDITIYCTQTDGVWTIVSEPNPIGKIPVSYYEQEYTEWNDVQALIERLEMLTSKKADQNDAFLDANASASLISATAADMISNEDDRLNGLIHYFTDTPDLSANRPVKLGKNSSQVLELRFFPALLKSIDKQPVFTEMANREINIIKALISKVIRVDLADQCKKLKVGIEFGNPLPENVKDMIDTLSVAVKGKAILSQETAVNLNPLVKDGTVEKKLLDEEELFDVSA